ncbi:MAG TPA: hypothetical protein VK427_15745, partial [Kofleriaceae bacterium]|nr:hypothetical protein [Kofleriaceae bacterium]
MNAAELLRAALDALPDPSWCEGIWEPASPLALAVGQSTRALDDEDLAAWLVAHSEPAPFGDANGTRHDTAVRDALRLVPRGEVRVVGFDPAEILE